MFALQIVCGIGLAIHPHAHGIAADIADLLIISFLIGVFRSWELIGGPEIGFAREVRALLREQQRADER